MRRTLAVLGGVVVFSGFLTTTPLYAQQSFKIYFGGFSPKGEDSRVNGDVFVNNRDFFVFDMDRLDSATIGGEWLMAFGDYSEFGVGLGIYSKEVPSRFSDLVNEDDLTEIRQDLRLRIIPLTATYRVLPAGRRAPLQPYLGIGLGILSWRYSETGEFVDFDGFIFRGRFAESGTSAGPIYLGGLRIPFGDWDLGGEVRYQSASGELDPEDFAGATKVDLGGFSYLATFNIRF